MKTIKLFICAILIAGNSFAQDSIKTQNKILELGQYQLRQNSLSIASNTVSGSEIDKSPVSTLSLGLTGRLSGLSISETSSQLSKEVVLTYLRGRHSTNGSGEPIIIIDGLISKTTISETITPAEIESITVLKDASALAIYGIDGANGAIVITTKRGQDHELKISATLENTFQEVSTKPTFINSWEYATMRNLASANDNLSQPYTTSQIEIFKSGSDTQKYSNTNWYNMFMNKTVMQQRVGVNVDGGNDKIKFFANLNVVNQGNQFISENEDYNASDHSQIYNFRANLDVNLFKNVSAYYRTSGSIGKDRVPTNYTVPYLYQSLFFMPSTVYGPLTENGDVIATANFNNPTYGILNRSGYTEMTSAKTINQMGLDINLGFITKGLKVGGYAAFETEGLGELKATQTYERWIRTTDLDEFEFIKKGDEVNSTLTYSKPSKFSYQIVFNGYANYQRNFGKHSVDAMIYGSYHNYSAEYQLAPYLYPFKSILSGAMLNYVYNNRYTIKADIGYSGSEQFPKDNRFFATPSVSGAWLLSNEKFLQNNKTLSFLKLRASYGLNANDDFGARRYAYSDEITFKSGGTISNLQYIINEISFANEDVEPEIVKKANIGVDLELFNCLTVNFDYFNEHLDNMYISSTTVVPAFQGVPLSNYPYTNSGKLTNKGFDLSITYSKQVNEDWKMSFGGLLSSAENKLVDVGEVELNEDYAYRYRSQGYSIGQQWGYLVDKSNGNGYFNTEEELENSGLTYDFGVPNVGDLIYKDLNNDKIIDEKDLAPIGNGSLPKFNYSFFGSVNYKNIDFSFLFQGISKKEVIESGYGFNESLLDGVYSEIHKQSWTQERYQNNETITFPALSTTTSTNHQASDFYKNNRAYLRLKNIELGYNLNKDILTFLPVNSLRFFLSGQNLLTFHSMKFAEFDPEGSYISIPVYKLYNIGLQIKF